jgi:hypothetical protein
MTKLMVAFQIFANAAKMVVPAIINETLQKADIIDE